MGVQIEELRAYFTANYAGYLKGVKAVQDAAKRLSDTSDAYAKKISSAFKASQKVVQTIAPELQKVSNAAGSALNRISVAAAGVVAKTTTSFGQFELTMKRAGAVTNTLGTETFKRLESAAIEMGRTTVYSAAEAAAAVEKLGLAGLSADEVMRALPGALELASSAQVDIATAADVAAKTMRAFGADAEALSHINDVLVKTFTTANTDMGQLAEAMKHAAPVSKGLGVSIEDTAAAIAKMSDAGFQGSIAGTALRNIMSRLAGATPQAISQLEALGVVTLDSSGKMRPFLDILEDIEKSGMSSADMLSIFGQRGGPQLMALMEVGTAELRRYSEELKNAGGIAKRISDANIDTLWGSFKMLESELETVVNDLGRQLKPALEQTFKLIIDNKPALIELANQFAALIQWVVKLAVENPKLTAALVTLRVSGLLGVNNLVSTLVGSFGRLSVSVIKLATDTSGLSTAIRLARSSFSILASAGASFTRWLTVECIPNLLVSISNFKDLASGTGSLKTAFSMLAATGLVVFLLGAQQAAAAFFSEVENINRAIGQTISLNQRMMSEDQKRYQNSVSSAEGDVEQMKKALEEEKRILAVREQAHRADVQTQQDYDPYAGLSFAEGAYTHAATGVASLLGINVGDTGKILENNTQESKRAEDAQRERVKELEKKIADQIAYDQAITPNVVRDAQTTDNPLSLVGDGSETNEAIRKAQISGMDSKSGGGFKEILELIQGGASGAELSQYLQAISTGTVGEDNASIDARDQLNDINASGGFQSQEQMDAFAMSVAQSMNSAIEGEERRLELIEEERQRIEDIPNVLKSIEGTTLDIKTQLAQLDEEAAGPLAGALENIQGRFQAGKMSADDFTTAMQGLKSATDQATAAAKREEEQKLREQILRGDFSGLNPMQALEDKLFQFRMQQFNGGIDAMFNQMMGLNRAVQPVVSGFGQLATQMQDFGSQLQGAMQPGGSGDNAGSAIFAWLSSLDGIAASLYNNISMLQQSLQFIQDPRRRQEIFDQIDAMQNQLNNLYQTPYTVGDAFDNIQDPGIGAGSNSISITLPNINRVTNADVRQLTDAIARELDQRGRRY